MVLIFACTNFQSSRKLVQIYAQKALRENKYVLK